MCSVHRNSIDWAMTSHVFWRHFYGFLCFFDRGASGGAHCKHAKWRIIHDERITHGNTSDLTSFLEVVVLNEDAK